MTHPEFCNYVDYFCRLPLIEEVLREYPNVEIVVSSTWRLEFEDEAESIAQMRKHFSFDIAPRVVGVTPDLRSSAQKKSLPRWAAGLREDECMAWLQRHRDADTHWVALDDPHACFGKDRMQVMIVNGATGFSPSYENELRRRLRA